MALLYFHSSGNQYRGVGLRPHFLPHLICSCILPHLWSTRVAGVIDLPTSECC